MSTKPLSTPASERLTIHHFKSGTLYSVREVMSLFGRCDQWVRVRIEKKELSATKLGGIGPWLVSGESVRILYGTLKLAEDVSGPPVKEESEEKVIKRAFAKLAKLNAKRK